MSTMQDVLDLARLDVNDSAKNRNFDSDWIKFANDGIGLAYALRPDLAFGTYGTAYVDLTTASTFPLPIEYRPAIAAYIVFRSETADDAFVIKARADESLTHYIKGLGL